MRRDRLSKLADYLEQVPEESFNIHYWRCGTVGCAMGHACDLFAEDGLILYEDRLEDENYPLYQNDQGYAAAQSFFELSRDESYRLFCPNWYIDASKKSVVKRIREMISTPQTIPAWD